MLVTKISPQKRKGLFNVFVDGKFEISLGAEDLVKEKLKAGEEISTGRLDELKYKGKFAYYLGRILNYLSFRPRSEKEIWDKLKEIAYREKGLDERLKVGLVDDVFNRVKRLKLVDDTEFGKWFVEGRLSSKKPSGKIKIRAELYKKGLSGKLIDELLGSVQNTNEIILKAANDRAKLLNKLTQPEFKRKLASYLLRKGFEPGEVFAVVDSLSKRKYNGGGLDIGDTKV